MKIKSAFLVAVLFLGVTVGYLNVGMKKAEAGAVEFDVVDLFDWGRLYDYAAGTDTFTPQNLNPYGNEAADPIVGSNSFGHADGKEDTWGIAQIDQIQNLPDDGTVHFDKEIDPYELTVFFASFDDDGISTPDFTGDVTIASTGGRLQVWKDYNQDYDQGGAGAGTLGTAGRTGDMAYTGATEGELVLDLVAVPVNSDGSTLLTGFNFTSLGGNGDVFWDIIGGTWADLYDTNSQIVPYNGYGADFFMQFTARDNSVNPTVGDWIVRGDGRAEANIVPEPTTIALLGIGLFGMAGVSARKHLRKKKELK